MSDPIQLTIELPPMPKYILVMLTIWLTVEMPESQSWQACGSGAPTVQP